MGNGYGMRSNTKPSWKGEQKVRIYFIEPSNHFLTFNNDPLPSSGYIHWQGGQKAVACLKNWKSLLHLIPGLRS